VFPDSWLNVTFSLFLKLDMCSTITVVKSMQKCQSKIAQVVVSNRLPFLHFNMLESTLICAYLHLISVDGLGIGLLSAGV